MNPNDFDGYGPSEEECANCGALYDCVPPWYYQTCRKCRDKARAKAAAATLASEQERLRVRDAMIGDTRP